ncbi:MAG TPA: HlyD family efflux transporter periplasmic adaptor subunit [bacterium]|nr:HlyD family efflux transporter periplasmic adaptor subunit [bacterium]
MKNPRVKISLLLLLPILFLACSRKAPENLIQLSGTLEMTEHGVGMPVAGRLTQVSVDEGDDVKQGQVLALTDRFDLAEREYQRQEQLLARGGGSRQAVEQAEMAMREQRVLSPIDGVVLTKVHESGEVVSGNSPVFILGDRNRMWVRIFVPEGFVSRIEMNQEATLHFDGLAEEFKGRVSFIAPRAEFTPRNVQTPEERVTQTFAVKIAIESPPKYLRPGVSAEVDLPMRPGAAP